MLYIIARFTLYWTSVISRWSGDNGNSILVSASVERIGGISKYGAELSRSFEAALAEGDGELLARCLG